MKKSAVNKIVSAIRNALEDLELEADITELHNFSIPVAEVSLIDEGKMPTYKALQPLTDVQRRVVMENDTATEVRYIFQNYSPAELQQHIGNIATLLSTLSYHTEGGGEEAMEDIYDELNLLASKLRDLE